MLVGKAAVLVHGTRKHEQMGRPKFQWQLRSRSLALGERTLLMGIVNVTPDSFSDGGDFFARDAALAHALRLLNEGADMLDLGGESTRPNATPVTAEDEQARILPVLAAILRARPETILSVDTYHSATAEAALDLGAEVVNDVSGLLWDPDMARVIARGRPGVILMHTRGKPQEWKDLPPLAQHEILPLVRRGLEQSVALAAEAGIPSDSIVLDPGFGFGKLGKENYVLLGRLAELRELGCPILAGISRKRFLTASIEEPTDADRLSASTASNVASILAGAHILRVHDVGPARVAAGVADAILAGRKSEPKPA